MDLLPFLLLVLGCGVAWGQYSGGEYNGPLPPRPYIPGAVPLGAGPAPRRRFEDEALPPRPLVPGAVPLGGPRRRPPPPLEQIQGGSRGGSRGGGARRPQPPPLEPEPLPQEPPLPPRPVVEEPLEDLPEAEPPRPAVFRPEEFPPPQEQGIQRLRPSNLPQEAPLPQRIRPAPQEGPGPQRIRPAPVPQDLPLPQRIRPLPQEQPLPQRIRPLPQEPVQRPRPQPQPQEQPQRARGGQGVVRFRPEEAPPQQRKQRPQEPQRPRPPPRQPQDEPQTPRNKKPVAQVLRKYREDNPDGSITWGFENDDGTFKEETIGIDCVTRGKYGYIDPEGVRREFSYSSGLPCDPETRDQADDQGYADYSNNKFVLPGGDSVPLDNMVKNRARKPLYRN